LKPPHFLLAAPNSQRLQQNLSHLLDAAALAALQQEFYRNIAGVYALGQDHLTFAVSLAKGHWRQRISRYYYAAYNIGRSVRLAQDGQYHTDVTDHKRVDSLPDGFPNKAKYTSQFAVLREDRNLCDYDHTVDLADLALSPDDVESLVADFAADAKVFLATKGITV
jgi:hypothetical protein